MINHIDNNNISITTNPLKTSEDIKHIPLLKDISLKTGDIILCHGIPGDEPLDKIIEEFTHSPWEHAALVIKDPWWTKPKLEGLYVFQSGSGENSYPDVITGSKGPGVTLNTLDDFMANRYWICIRSLNNIEWTWTQRILFQHLFEVAHGKPYDYNICSWIGTGIGSCLRCHCLSNRSTPKETEDFWCSALVAFIYTRMEWCDKKLDWSSQTPADLSGLTVNLPLELSDIWRYK